MKFPIMRTVGASPENILPYLRRIEENHCHSNWGPLNAEYERRLSEMFNCHVVTTSSATSGLAAALMALLPFNYKSRAMVAMPSWTFCATASAIFSAGFRPLVCDVDENDILDIADTGGCQAYMVVAPFGKPLDLQYWDRFSEIHKKPVVIDAASGFDSFQSLKIGNSPVVISAHCTKTFSTGEGGFVLSQDKDLIDKIRRITNQGMMPDKSVNELGINAKMSEYSAAVGLASLDEWGEKRQRWIEIESWYGGQTDYATSTHGVLLDVPAAPIVKKLEARGIQSRSSWYGTCHKQDAYMKAWCQDMGLDGKIHMPMTRTDMLAKNTIFLPKYIGMLEDDVIYIKDCLKECLDE